MAMEAPDEFELRNIQRDWTALESAAAAELFAIRKALESMESTAHNNTPFFLSNINLTDGPDEGVHDVPLHDICCDDRGVPAASASARAGEFKLIHGQQQIIDELQRMSSAIDKFGDAFRANVRVIPYIHHIIPV
jgi:hypothetical protein